MPPPTRVMAAGRGYLAYAAYCRAVKYRSIHGEPLMSYPELPEPIQRGWIAAADAIWDLAHSGEAII